MIPALLLASGCVSVPHPSATFARLPTLQAQPLQGTCRFGEDTKACVAVLESDWEALVIYAKGACLALGGDKQGCQAGE